MAKRNSSKDRLMFYPSLMVEHLVYYFDGLVFSFDEDGFSPINYFKNWELYKEEIRSIGGAFFPQKPFPRKTPIPSFCCQVKFKEIPANKAKKPK